MDERQTVKLSKFLSLVLRHEPGKVGIALDSAGWVGVGELLDALARRGWAVGEAELRQVVETSDKKRFALSEDGRRIRASQGHSVEVELGYEPVTPPEVLYHGTVGRFLESILERGLSKGERHHVHLSADVPTAVKVGERRGEAVLLKVEAGRMGREGFVFYVSANGVWLTDHVPAGYLSVVEG